MESEEILYTGDLLALAEASELVEYGIRGGKVSAYWREKQGCEALAVGLNNCDTEHVLLMSFAAVAVIVADPDATAVTVPSAATVTTPSGATLHVMVLSVASAGKTLAETLPVVPPTVRVSGEGVEVISTLVTGTVSSLGSQAVMAAALKAKITNNFR